MFDFAPQRPEPGAVTLLREARILVATPEQWCRGLSRIGDARCMGNALSTVCMETRVRLDIEVACRLLRLALTEGITDVPVWNDQPHRTHEEVLAAFDRAIVAGLMEHEKQRELAHV